MTGVPIPQEVQGNSLVPLMLASDPAHREVPESLRTKNAILVKQFRGQSPLNTYIETMDYE